jgi:hypothetical protein
MVGDTYLVKGNMNFFICTTRISLHGDDLSAKFTFNKVLKIKKHLIDFTMLLEQINPNKFTIIINKYYTVLLLSTETRAGPQNTCSNETMKTLVEIE